MATTTSGHDFGVFLYRNHCFRESAHLCLDSHIINMMLHVRMASGVPTTPFGLHSVVMHSLSFGFVEVAF